MGDTLETVDLKDVEILAPGTWKGNRTVTIKPDDISAFVAAFDELTANDKLNYEPPAKLGHDDGQKILQADGYPAAGWVSKLVEKGGKLVADFKGVPKKLAEIIGAGGYKKVSAEFYQDYEIGGKKYPWVLKAVAFLGADVPACKSIDDMVAQYSEGILLDENKVPFGVIVMDETVSLDKQSQAVRDAYYIQCKPQKEMPMVTSDTGWVKEVFADYIIVEKDGTNWQIPYTTDGANVVFDAANAVEVKQVYQSVTAPEGNPDESGNGMMAEWSAEEIDKLPDSAFSVIKSGGEKDAEGKTAPRDLRMLPYKGPDGKVDLPHLRNALSRLPQADLSPAERAKAEEVLQKAAKDAGIDELTKNSEQEVHMEKELRALLKLDEKANVLEAVKALKSKADANAVSLDEQTQLTDKVKTLETQLAESTRKIALKERDERVSKAINARKLLPKQREWAEGYAMSDPTGFDAFIAAAPEVVKLGEVGTGADKGGPAETATLTEADRKYAKQFGVSEELVAATKSKQKSS